MCWLIEHQSFTGRIYQASVKPESVTIPASGERLKHLYCYKQTHALASHQAEIPAQMLMDKMQKHSTTGVFTVLARRGMNGSLVFGSSSKTSKVNSTCPPTPQLYWGMPAVGTEDPVETAGTHPAAPPGAANTASVPQTSAGCAADVRRRGSTAGLLHFCARRRGRDLPLCMRSCLCPFNAESRPSAGGRRAQCS